MDVRTLGPLEAHEDGISVVPTAGKPRQILALLALNAGRVITVPTLMNEIWGEAIPRSAATTLQTYILQIRRMIATALLDDPVRQAKDVLVTRHGGYLLEVQPGLVDADEFELAAANGRMALEEGDPWTASAVLSQALSLWRGPALVDVPVGGVLELEVLRLEGNRTATLERRITADLMLGRHSELVPELQVLAARYPLHENFCAQLIIALCRAEGAWRALDAYQRLRDALVRDLGLEPSPRLRQLQRSILIGEPDLGLPVSIMRPPGQTELVAHSHPDLRRADWPVWESRG